MDCRAVLVGKVYGYSTNNRDELLIRIKQDDKYPCIITTKNIHKYVNSNGEIEFDYDEVYIFDVEVQVLDFDFFTAKHNIEKLDDQSVDYPDEYFKIIEDNLYIHAYEVPE